MQTELDDPVAVVLHLHRLLAEGVDAPDLAHIAVERVSALMRGTAALWLVLPDDEVEAVAFHHPDPEVDRVLQSVTGGRVRGTHRMVREVMASGQQVQLDPQQLVAAAQLMEPVYRTWFGRRPVSEMVLQPLRIGGRSTGLLGVARDAGQPRLNGGEVLLLTQVAQVMTAALQAQLVRLGQGRLLAQTRESEARLHALAHTDDLTQLPNRRGLLAALAAVEQPLRAPLAVALLDLDDFKHVNDGFGHAAGDGLLRSFADLLRTVLPPRSVVARMGGDEFSVLLRPHGSGSAEQQLSQVLDACPETLPVLHVDVPVRVSAGVAVREVGETVDAGELLREADVAMYRAKRRRLRLARFDAEADDAALSRLQDAARLRRALEERDLVLHYQRIVPGRGPVDVERFEALLRWPLSDDGLQLPGSFLPLAQEIGAMDQVTDLVVDLALEQVTTWTSEGRRVQVALNVPASCLARPGFPESVVARLQHAGLAATTLSVEVTEGELVDAVARAAVESCRRLGLPVAIDDFGMGYSALGYLLDVPAREMKIDRGLVSRIAEEDGKRVLVEHCISLAHALGIEVVAEGVETAAEQEVLVALGADWLQGYHLHRPCAPEALAGPRA